MLPPEAGTAIGGRSYSPYVLLEIHYNNPSMAKGMTNITTEVLPTYSIKHSLAKGMTNITAY